MSESGRAHEVMSRVHLTPFGLQKVQTANSQYPCRETAMTATEVTKHHVILVAPLTMVASTAPLWATLRSLAR